LANTAISEQAIQALQEFSTMLLPLRLTIEALFQVFLPKEHEKYTLAYNIIYNKAYGKGK